MHRRAMRMIWPLMAILVATAIPAVAQPVTMAGERPIGRDEVRGFISDQFSQVDANRDGFVTSAELQSFRSKLDAQGKADFDEISARAFGEADIDGDGRVARWEVEQRSAQIFDLVDMDRDGIASIEEQTLAMTLFGG